MDERVTDDSLKRLVASLADAARICGELMEIVSRQDEPEPWIDRVARGESCA